MSENRCDRCDRPLKDPKAQYGWQCAKILGISQLGSRADIENGKSKFWNQVNQSIMKGTVYDATKLSRIYDQFFRKPKSAFNERQRFWLALQLEQGRNQKSRAQDSLSQKGQKEDEHFRSLRASAAVSDVPLGIQSRNPIETAFAGDEKSIRDFVENNYKFKKGDLKTVADFTEDELAMLNRLFKEDGEAARVTYASIIYQAKQYATDANNPSLPETEREQANAALEYYASVIRFSEDAMEREEEEKQKAIQNGEDVNAAFEARLAEELIWNELLFIVEGERFGYSAKKGSGWVGNVDCAPFLFKAKNIDGEWKNLNAFPNTYAGKSETIGKLGSDLDYRDHVDKKTPIFILPNEEERFREVAESLVGKFSQEILKTFKTKYNGSFKNKLLKLPADILFIPGTDMYQIGYLSLDKNGEERGIGSKHNGTASYLYPFEIGVQQSVNQSIDPPSGGSLTNTASVFTETSNFGPMATTIGERWTHVSWPYGVVANAAFLEELKKIINYDELFKGK